MITISRVARIVPLLFLLGCIGGAREQVIRDYQATEAAIAREDGVEAARLMALSKANLARARAEYGAKEFMTRSIVEAEKRATQRFASWEVQQGLLALREKVKSGPLSSADSTALSKLSASPVMESDDRVKLKTLADVVLREHVKAQSFESFKVLVAEKRFQDAHKLMFGPLGTVPKAVPWWRSHPHFSDAFVLETVQAMVSDAIARDPCDAMRMALDIGSKVPAGPSLSFAEAEMPRASSACLDVLRAKPVSHKDGTHLLESLRLLARGYPPSAVRTAFERGLEPIDAHVRSLGGGMLWTLETSPEYLAARAAEDDQINALEKSGDVAGAMALAQSLKRMDRARSIDLAHPSPVVGRLRRRMGDLIKKHPVAAAMLQGFANQAGDLNPVVAKDSPAMTSALALSNVPLPTPLGSGLEILNAPNRRSWEKRPNERTSPLSECEVFIYDQLTPFTNIPEKDWMVEQVYCNRGAGSKVSSTEVRTETHRVLREVPTGIGSQTRSVFFNETVAVTENREYQVPGKGALVLSMTWREISTNLRFSASVANTDSRLRTGSMKDMWYFVQDSIRAQQRAAAMARHQAEQAAQLRDAYTQLQNAKDNDARDLALALIAFRVKGQDPVLLDIIASVYDLPRPLKWPF